MADSTQIFASACPLVCNDDFQTNARRGSPNLKWNRFDERDDWYSSSFSYLVEVLFLVLYFSFIFLVLVTVGVILNVSSRLESDFFSPKRENLINV